MDEFQVTDLVFDSSPSEASTVSTLGTKNLPRTAPKAAAAAAGKKSSNPIGRRVHSAWKFITNDPNAHQQPRTVCKNCNMVVRTSKKSERAKSHLLRCAPSLVLLSNLDDKDKPDWYFENPDSTNDRKRKADKPADTAANDRKRKELSFVVPKLKSQKLADTRLLSSLRNAEKKRMDEALASFFYNTGTPLQHVQDPHLLQFCKLLRPDYVPPTSSHLAGPLLDNIYDKVRADVLKFINSSPDAPPFWCLTTSIAQHKNQELLLQAVPMVNYRAVSASASLFLEGVSSSRTGAEDGGHDAEFLANDISRVMKSINADKFSGVLITDATTTHTPANIKAAWKLLETEFPNKFFGGCASHGLQLLVQDIFVVGRTATTTTHSSSTQTNQDGETAGAADCYFPDAAAAAAAAGDDPFVKYLEFTSDCKDVVDFFQHKHNRHGPREKFPEELKMLVMPKRCGGNLSGCFTSLLAAAQPVLLPIVSAPDFVPEVAAAAAVAEGNTRSNAEKWRQRIKEIVMADNFVSELQKCVDILQPIDKRIKEFQSDEKAAPMLSDVYDAFLVELPRVYDNMDCLSDNEKKYIQQLIRTRYSFLGSNAHSIAYLLDPRYVAEGMSLDTRHDALMELCNFPIDCVADSDEDKQRVYVEYTKYNVYISLLKRNKTDIGLETVITGKRSVLQFWQYEGNKWPLLRKFAVRLFCMAASSVHHTNNINKLVLMRNKQQQLLGPESVQKLVYVETNSSQIRKATGRASRRDYKSIEPVDVDEDNGVHV